VKVREGAKAPSLKSLPYYGEGIKKKSQRLFEERGIQVEDSSRGEVQEIRAGL